MANSYDRRDNCRVNDCQKRLLVVALDEAAAEIERLREENRRLRYEVASISTTAAM